MVRAIAYSQDLMNESGHLRYKFWKERRMSKTLSYWITLRSK